MISHLKLVKPFAYFGMWNDKKSSVECKFSYIRYKSLQFNMSTSLFLKIMKSQLKEVLIFYTRDFKVGGGGKVRNKRQDLATNSMSENGYRDKLRGCRLTK
jgi:hypothetical protein